MTQVIYKTYSKQWKDQIVLTIQRAVMTLLEFLRVQKKNYTQRLKTMFISAAIFHQQCHQSVILSTAHDI